MVSRTEEILKLQQQEVLKYLSMEEIIVKSEESIFECLLRGIEVSPDSRSEHFYSLVKAVRFPLLTEHFLATEMK